MSDLGTEIRRGGRALRVGETWFDWREPERSPPESIHHFQTESFVSRDRSDVVLLTIRDSREDYPPIRDGVPLGNGRNGTAVVSRNQKGPAIYRGRVIGGIPSL